MSVPNPSDCSADEIHFFKESKDGVFSTSKGYTFFLLEEKLFLLYQYDLSNITNPFMTVCEIPAEISDYFCALLKELPDR